MDQIARHAAAYFGTPLIGKRRLRDYAGTYLMAAAAVIAAIVLVHAFAPPGLTAMEFVLHLITLTLSFALGLAVAGWAVVTRVNRRGAGHTVQHLWIISAAGFAVGILISGLAEELPLLAPAANKATSVHGATSMLLRLLPVWAILTAFVARAEILRTYKIWLRGLDLGVGGSPALPGWDDIATIESGNTTYAFQHADIVCAIAEQNYTQLLVRDGEATNSVLVRATFKSILDLLPGAIFVQIHRSHAVNRGHIKSIGRSGRHFYVAMKNADAEFTISRRRLRDVMAKLNSN